MLQFQGCRSESKICAHFVPVVGLELEHAKDPREELVQKLNLDCPFHLPFYGLIGTGTMVLKLKMETKDLCHLALVGQ